MITLFLAENEEKVKEAVSQLLNKIGNTNIDIVKSGNTIQVLEKDDLKDLVSLKEKVIQLVESLYNEEKGRLYRAVLDIIERPVIEYVLERNDGNQLKAARILGINRNTMRAKIKRLDINVAKYKQNNV